MVRKNIALLRNLTNRKLFLIYIVTLINIAGAFVFFYPSIAYSVLYEADGFIGLYRFVCHSAPDRHKSIQSNKSTVLTRL